MPRTFRIILLSLIATGMCTMAGAWAQPPTAPPTGPGASPPAAGRGPTIPGANDVLATITVGTQTDKVTKGELFEILSRYAIPDDDRETLYRQGIDNKINTKLLLMYLLHAAEEGHAWRPRGWREELDTRNSTREALQE